MLVLRATKKAQRHLPAATLDREARGTGALGDWYVNKVSWGRKPLLLLVSSTTLLPILVPASDGRSLLARFPAILQHRLLRMGIAPELVAAEAATCSAGGVGATVDRSVLGTMNDFGASLQWHWHDHPGVLDLAASEDYLADTPCRAGSRHPIWPEMDAPRRLVELWRPDAAVYVSTPTRLRH